MLVRALRDCFVGSYHGAGEEFEYDGPKNENLEPVKTAKRASSEKPAEKDNEVGL